RGGRRRRSATASTLLACLELTRDGRLELSQSAPFEDIYVRDRAGSVTHLETGTGTGGMT
ncbi:MAG: hypothetical protein ACREFW_08385, partial [Rhizomicrobium sp.]